MRDPDSLGWMSAANCCTNLSCSFQPSGPTLPDESSRNAMSAVAPHWRRWSSRTARWIDASCELVEDERVGACVALFQLVVGCFALLQAGGYAVQAPHVLADTHVFKCWCVRLHDKQQLHFPCFIEQIVRARIFLVVRQRLVALVDQQFQLARRLRQGVPLCDQTREAGPGFKRCRRVSGESLFQNLTGTII